MGDPLNDHPILTLLGELFDVPAPSGREERLAALVTSKLEALGLTVESDRAGNVWTRLAGADSNAGTMMVAAHIDEIGMVVTNIHDDGTLSVSRSGLLFPYKIGEGPIQIIGDTGIVTGVLGVGSTHTANPETRTVEWKDATVVTGLSRDSLAKAGVRIGSTAVTTRERRGPIVFGEASDPMVGAWLFDDRLGVALELLLLEWMVKENITPHMPMIAAFTVHEEGGCHGAKVAAHREQPEVFLAIDGCPITPGSPIVVDGRPAVWTKDKKCHYNQPLVQDLIAAGRSVGIDPQLAILDNAYSDASSVYDVGGAEAVGIVGYPRYNSHGYEVTSLRTIDNTFALLKAFIQRAK